ncbi:unnamed protein product [Periconia digitata]|uniref:Ribosomal protein L9 domain-containing protein n=1 Tax=Periconia digitata TaxID=1303443 RepID=A0A9W4UQ06_9PLEO|nr:unnamed protein product [Periconia digitata]
MASSMVARPALLPQCPSCIRRVTRHGLGGAVQHTRNLSKAAKETKKNIAVKLLADVPKFGKAGSYVPLSRTTMRNRWFPARIADYVTLTQLKQLKAQGVLIERDLTFGVPEPLEEIADQDDSFLQQKKHYVRPIELELLSPERSMELIDTFVPPTIDFTRQLIEQDSPAKQDSRRHGASEAADILSSISFQEKPKVNVNSIYGSVSTTDVANTIKAALAHNDEAARVLLSDSDIKFITGFEEDDTSRLKQVGSFKVEIQLSGAEAPLLRTVRIRAKE